MFVGATLLSPFGPRKPEALAGRIAAGGEQPGSRDALPARIGYLVSRYPAVSHTFILREVTGLRERGLAIEVASINPPDRPEARMSPRERSEGLRTYGVKSHGWRGALAGHFWALRHPGAYLRGLGRALRLCSSNPRRLTYGFFYFTEALMLWRWMARHRLQHLHVHFATAAANVALVLRHCAPITLSLTVHGPDEFYDTRGEWLTEKIAAADFVVCIGQFARSQLMHVSPAEHWHKFEVCPLGVDPQRYLPAAGGDARQAFTILCVGRLTPAKGQRILIDACRRLRAQGRRLRLVLVGTGPDENRLKEFVASRGLDEVVEFTGALNESEVREWYARADVFALASFAEGIPVVLMEAMASGIPCVSTRITGIPELIRDGVDGLLVAPSDVDELAGTLACLMDDGELRAELARSGRARIEADYDLTRNLARLAGVFTTRLGVHA